MKRMAGIRFSAGIFLLILCLSFTGRASQAPFRTIDQPMAPDSLVFLQVAASDVFIEPQYFRDKFNTSEEIRMFRQRKWYRYVAGPFPTEADALSKRTQFGADAYILYLRSSDTLGMNIPQAPRPGPREIQDTSGEPVIGSDTAATGFTDRSDSTFRLAVKEADSLYLTGGDLLTVRQLYGIAAAIRPEDRYVADQVMEIDRQLQDRSQGTFSRKGRSGWVLLTGLLVSVTLVAAAALVGRTRRRRAGSVETNRETGSTKPAVREFNREVGATAAAGADFSSKEVFRRLQAELEWIGHHPGKPLDFLRELEYPFTPIEQLHVFEYLKRHGIRPGELLPLISSDHPGVASFALRLIRAFGPYPGIRGLLPALDHPDPEVREECVMVLASVGKEDAIEWIRKRYRESSSSGKEQVMRALSRLPADSGQTFESLLGTQEPDMNLALNMPDLREPVHAKGIEVVFERHIEDIQSVARHLLDFKINR